MDRPVGATAGQDQDHEAIPGHGAGAASGAVPKSGAKKPRRKVVRGARDGQGGVTPYRRWRDVRGRHFTYNDFPHRNPMGPPRKVDSHPVNIYKS